jgi:MFS family permease
MPTAERWTLRWLPLWPLMVGTLLGTLNNNIVNVPLKQMLRSLHVPLSRGALVVIVFNLAFAVLMPIVGWLADRLGRRRMFCWSVMTVMVGAVGAMLAPDLLILVGCRIVQAVGSAGILPTVMAIIAELYDGNHRGRALGAWAAANGLGQAIGPPLGGLLASVLSWRLVFAPAPPLAALALLGALRLLPRSIPVSQPLDWRGAAALTAGAGLLVTSVTIAPIVGVGSPLVWLLSSAGAGLLAAFAVGIRRRVRPFITPSLFREPSYVRSSLAVFAQMFCLGATLLAIPLLLTHATQRSTGATGLLLFPLPAAMAVLAPIAGRAAERWTPRRTLRLGAAFLVVTVGGVSVDVATAASQLWLLEVLLVAEGAAIAFVQTPAATGATRTVGGRLGAGVGLFNLIRFAGSALGAAWVSIALSSTIGYGPMFGGCTAMAALGLAGTWARTRATPRSTPPELTLVR